MKIRMKLLLVASGLACLGLAAGSYAQQASTQTKASAQKEGSANKMSFFITSAGSGKGADLGGLAGADKHCQTLAAAAGAGQRTWRAYLSTSSFGGGKPVNARDRIGRGPWYNAKGELIAKNVDDLHDNPNINRETGLTEKGAMLAERGMHDILTGSDSQGRAFPGDMDTTCGNWTKSTDGSAQLGHHDRRGLSDKPHAKSWVHSHPSIGCSQELLRKTGGSGLFYCFAAR